MKFSRIRDETIPDLQHWLGSESDQNEPDSPTLYLIVIQYSRNYLKF
jgi:hypothetical protein